MSDKELIKILKYIRENFIFRDKYFSGECFSMSVSDFKEIIEKKFEINLSSEDINTVLDMLAVNYSGNTGNNDKDQIKNFLENLLLLMSNLFIDKNSKYFKEKIKFND